MNNADLSLKPEINLSILGGCHVLGLMVGKENGFVSISSKKLREKGFNIKAKAFPYFNLKLSKDVIDVCKHTQTDILIVQCHYIFNPYILKPLKEKLFGKKAPNEKRYKWHKAYSDCRVEDADATFVSTKKFQVAQFFKHLFHCLFFYKVLNKKQCTLFIDDFFSAIKKSGVKDVVILSPFPCTDKVVNRYRKMGTELLYQKSLEYGFNFVDVFSAIQEEYRGRIFTIDDGHLNKKAHAMLGELLSDYLIKHKLNVKLPAISMAS